MPRFINIQLLFLLLTLHYSSITFSQRSEYVYRDKTDSTVNCYLKVYPETEVIKGLIVRDYSSLPEISKKSPYRWMDLALENGLMTVFTVTSNYFPEMYYTDSCLYLLDEMVAEVIQHHNIPKENIFIGGISASGTRALKYAQFCEMEKSRHGTKVKGVFAVDPPLDLERFYYSATRNKKNFKKGMLWEANLMEKVFPEKMGGPPAKFQEAYQNASVFSHSHTEGGNAKYLKDVHLILFHEPDIDWWLHERGCGYYDFNSFDIAALVVKLKSMDGNKVEMVTTTGKGFDREGNRNCHSWTIVDEEYLMEWVLARVE